VQRDAQRLRAMLQLVAGYPPWHAGGRTSLQYYTHMAYSAGAVLSGIGGAVAGV